MIEEIVADPIVVEKPTQEECQSVTHRVSLCSELVKTNSEALNLTLVIDEFDIDTFDEIVDTELHVEDDDEAAISESDEERCNLQLTQLPMNQSAQLMKAMRKICPPQ
jgi:hypothetical protein